LPSKQGKSPRLAAGVQTKKEAGSSNVLDPHPLGRRVNPLGKEFISARREGKKEEEGF